MATSTETMGNELGRRQVNFETIAEQLGYGQERLLEMAQSRAGRLELAEEIFKKMGPAGQQFRGGVGELERHLEGLVKAQPKHEDTLDKLNKASKRTFDKAGDSLDSKVAKGALAALLIWWIFGGKRNQEHQWFDWAHQEAAGVSVDKLNAMTGGAAGINPPYSRELDVPGGGAGRQGSGNLPDTAKKKLPSAEDEVEKEP